MEKDPTIKIVINERSIPSGPTRRKTVRSELADPLIEDAIFTIARQLKADSLPITYTQ